MDQDINRKNREEDEDDDDDMEEKEKTLILNKSGSGVGKKRPAPISDDTVNTNEQLSQPSTSNGNNITVQYRSALHCVAILPSYNCYHGGLSANYELSSDSGSSTSSCSSSCSDLSLDIKKRKGKKMYLENIKKRKRNQY